MATVDPRKGKDGAVSWRCRVRIGGAPMIARTFTSRKRAEEWGRLAEQAIAAQQEEEQIAEVRRTIEALRDKRMAERPVSQRIKEAEEFLVDLATLRANRHPSPSSSGVYFLFNGERLVYIGRTTHGLARIHKHKRDKTFDSYTFLEVPRVYLGDVETLFIQLYGPELNVRSGNDLAHLLNSWAALRQAAAEPQCSGDVS